MPCSESLYWSLVYSVLVSLVVLTVGSGVVLLYRQPARQLRIIELTLVGCLIVPWLGMIPGYPQLTVGWRHAVAPEQHGIIAPPSVGQIVVPPAPQTDLVPLAVPNVSSQSITEPIGKSTHGWNVRSWLVALYLLGVSMRVVWWLVGMAALLRIIKASRPASPRCHQLLVEVAGRSITGVRLLVSRQAKQPFASAWWPMTIVLPEDMCGDEQALRWALAHEWSHIERHDFRAWFTAGLARVLFFYQPLVWWLHRQLRLCQDFMADAGASRQAPQPEDYAEFLTRRAAAGSLHPTMVGLGIGFRKSELCRRVLMLVNDRPLENRAPRLWAALVTCAAMVLVTTVSALSIAPQAAAEGDSAGKREITPAPQERHLEKQTKQRRQNQPRTEAERPAIRLPVRLSLEDNAKAEISIAMSGGKMLKTMFPGIGQLDLTAAGNGKHYLYFECRGYASQTACVEIIGGRTSEAEIKVKLFRKRYAILRCAFNTHGRRSLEGDEVQVQRIALPHWTAPNYFNQDWQIWQKSDGVALFGDSPYFEFHRYTTGFGFVKPVSGVSYEAMKEAPETGYRCESVKAEKGVVLYCRVNGDRAKGLGYGKVLVEGVTETPPNDVRVVEAPSRVLDSPTTIVPAAVATIANHTTGDPIGNLIDKLNADEHGMWVNGMYPAIKLPSNAAPEEILAQAVKMIGFDQGHIKTYRLQEVRRVKLKTAGMGTCSAALVESDLGAKVLLFRYEGPTTGWWTRFYDASKESKVWSVPREPQ